MKGMQQQMASNPEMAEQMQRAQQEMQASMAEMMQKMQGQNPFNKNGQTPNPGQQAGQQPGQPPVEKQEGRGFHQDGSNPYSNSDDEVIEVDLDDNQQK